MKIFETSEEIRKYRNSCQGSIGLVTTMGNLHEGHLSLIKRSLDENEKTIVSIFVNPTQFNDTNDFKNYPNTLSEDLSALSALHTDACFLPTVEALYPDNYELIVTEKTLSNQLEGKYREAHFDGVLTVLLKLFNLIRANNTYFGEKDYQQYLLVKKLCHAFFIPTTVHPHPTVREQASFLALSSRNNRLSQDERTLAAKMAELFHTTDCIEKTKQAFAENDVKLEYLEECFDRRFIAFYIGKVRLIDNYSLGKDNTKVM